MEVILYKAYFLQALGIISRQEKLKMAQWFNLTTSLVDLPNTTSMNSHIQSFYMLFIN